MAIDDKNTAILTKYQAYGAQATTVSNICTQTEKALNNTKEGSTMPRKNSITLNLTLL